jgi:hypothetical protein
MAIVTPARRNTAGDYCTAVSPVLTGWNCWGFGPMRVTMASYKDRL